MTQTYHTAASGETAQPIVLVDPSTGAPYAAGGNPGAAQDSTLQSVLGALVTPATALPPTPLNTVSGLTVTPFSRAAIGSAVLVAAVASKVIRCYRHHHICEAAQRVEYWDGDPASGGTLLRRFGYTSTNGGGAVFDRDQDAYFQTTAGNALYIKTTTAAETDGAVGTTQV